MGSRALIAKIERDGSGRYIQLGHGCYPDDAGTMLLEHYSEPDEVGALITEGAVCQLGNTIQESTFYYREYDDEWAHCSPITFENGTEELFTHAYLLGPEWLYAWTPDGWLAAETDRNLPDDFLEKLAKMQPEAFQDWFDNNQEPAWVEWRRQVRETQRPQPLVNIIKQYTESDSAHPPA